jgi:hypothetical protein
LHSAVDLDFCFTKVKFSSLLPFFKEKSRKFHFQVFAVGGSNGPSALDYPEQNHHDGDYQ